MTFVSKLALAGATLTACTFGGTLRFDTIGIGYTNVPMTVFGTSANEYAVVLNISINGSPYVAFCVDVLRPISTGTTYNMGTGAPNSLPNGERAAWIYLNYINTIATGNAADNTFNASAIQLALWDVIHDGGDGFSAGNIRVNAGSNSTWQSLALAANNIVTASAGRIAGNATILYNYRIDNNLQAQTLITGAVPAPEPSTIAFMSAGAALVGIRLRKRRRQAARE